VLIHPSLDHGNCQTRRVLISRTMTVKLLVRMNALPLTKSVTVAVIKLVLGHRPRWSPMPAWRWVAPPRLKVTPGGAERRAIAAACQVHPDPEQKC